MLTGLLVASSASTTPPNDSGSDSRMVIGWNTLPNSSTSTPSTIIRPVPMAVMKPVEHLVLDLGVAGRLQAHAGRQLLLVDAP